MVVLEVEIIRWLMTARTGKHWLFYRDSHTCALFFKTVTAPFFAADKVHHELYRYGQRYINTHSNEQRQY